MQVGHHVRWAVDDEPGTITGITEHAIQIQWEVSGIRERYSFWSGVMERIQPVSQFSCNWPQRMSSLGQQRVLG